MSRGSNHAGEDVEGDGLAGLVVAGEGADEFGVFEELFEHLGGDFDEVAFSGDAGLAGPALAAAEDLVHEVAELMEASDDVGVLQEAGVGGGGLREVANERGFGELMVEDAADEGALAEPLALAFAGVHVEVDAADGLGVGGGGRVVVEDGEGFDAGGPDGGVFCAEEDYAEEFAGGGEDAGFDLLVGEVGADGLGVEVVAGAAVLLFPEAGVGEGKGEGVGVAFADEGFELGELLLGGIKGGGFDFVEERAHVGGGTHHLVDGGEVGPAAKA